MIFIKKCKIITLKIKEENLHVNENANIYFIQNALKTIKTDVKHLKSSQKAKIILDFASLLTFTNVLFEFCAEYRKRVIMVRSKNWRELHST